MNVALSKPMTQEEFFPWAQARDERYEFDGFQPVAMTGGSANHNRLVRNIAFELRRPFGDVPIGVRRHEDLFFLERKKQRTSIRLECDRSPRLRPIG